MSIGEILEWDHANLAQSERQKLPQYERILGDSLLRAPKVLLAADLGWPEDPETIPPIGEAPLLRNVRGDLRAVPEWTVIEHEPKEELRLASTIGFTNIPESAHTVSSVPLVLRYQGRVVPTSAAPGDHPLAEAFAGRCPGRARIGDHASARSTSRSMRRARCG